MRLVVLKNKTRNVIKLRRWSNTDAFFDAVGRMGFQYAGRSVPDATQIKRCILGAIDYKVLQLVERLVVSAVPRKICIFRCDNRFHMTCFLLDEF